MRKKIIIAILLAIVGVLLVALPFTENGTPLLLLVVLLVLIIIIA